MKNKVRVRWLQQHYTSLYWVRSVAQTSSVVWVLLNVFSTRKHCGIIEKQRNVLVMKKSVVISRNAAEKIGSCTLFIY